MKFINTIMSLILRFLILSYQAIFSASAGRQCRFEPTCSHYATQALKQHHIVYALWLIIKRLWKCAPLSAYRGGWHYDPVPSHACASCDDDTKTPQK